MAVILRDALAQEFNDIASLAVEAYHEYSHVLTLDNWETMRANLSNVAEIAKQGQAIVAQRDRELVGLVVYCPPGTSDNRLFQPEWASLRMLAVSPQHRGQGIGQQLSLECVHRAKQDKAEVVGLQLILKNRTIAIASVTLSRDRPHQACYHCNYRLQCAEHNSLIKWYKKITEIGRISHAEPISWNESLPRTARVLVGFPQSIGCSARSLVSPQTRPKISCSNG